MVNALGVTDRSTRAAADKVLEHLRERQVLLVIDNCEHVAHDVAASSTGSCVARAQYGSWPPAGTPSVSRGSTSSPFRRWRFRTSAGLQQAAVTSQFDAVRLLADRVAAIRPGFAVTRRERRGRRPAVRPARRHPAGDRAGAPPGCGRCRSSRSSSGSTGRFALLTGGSAAAQPRQQTLRALVDWSHSLCSPSQRLLWARLSVFNGSFDLAAAEAVCADGDLAPQDAVLDLLDHLVAQSIVAGRPRQSAVSGSGCSRRSGSTAVSGSRSVVRPL